MESIKLLVEGGKASPGPQTASLASMGLNVGEVISKINEMTKDFQGMQVPVTIEVDPETKEYNIKVGSPPVSALIKKELGVQKLAKAPFGTYKPKEGEEAENFEASLSMEQVKKIAKMKFGSDSPEAVKQIIGTCQSCGVKVDNKEPKEVLKELSS
ncbi:MAG: 50S ribosomal protein L11 [Candidatus Micrarchaeota archaeon]|nr:50S ribosomal protein L11 [Candidatus Micrarchaeota archaeon]